MSAKTAQRKDASKNDAGTNGKRSGGAARRTRARPLTVVVVGSGRLGTAMAGALAASGHNVAAVVARQAKHAREAAALVSPRPRALTTSELDALPPADLLLITTPDDAIAETASRIAAVTPAGRAKRAVALHMSGATSSEALVPLRSRGFDVGSMHPLVSISEPATGMASLRTAFYCIEGDPKAVRLASRVVRELGGKSFSIKVGDKALYHAAAVLSCNHLVGLFDLAVELLALCGLREPQALRVLTPLLRDTCENIAARGPRRALTGPFVRADVATVRRHLRALEARTSGEVTAVYTLLGRRLLRLAQERGVDAALLNEIALELGRAEGVGQKPAG